MRNRFPGLARPIQPDYEALLQTLRREGTPARVHHMELFHDAEIVDAIAAKFDLARDLRPDDPDRERLTLLNVRRFLGFDYVSTGLNVDVKTSLIVAEDTAETKRAGGRSFVDEHRGPITTWDEFADYPWPDPHAPGATRDLDWWAQHLPEDMCLAAHTGHFAEFLCWLMGYETLCYALHDQRDLVQAVFERTLAFHEAEVRLYLACDRVKIIWGSDDMGYRSGLLFCTADMRRFALAGHKRLAQLAHDAGRLYLLHSCGELSTIMEDLIEDVQIDGKHSFEDTILDVREAKRRYGRRVALIGGIDVDFLCRAPEADIRARVRDTLNVCQPGGGYCLGTGNSVANYIPLDQYLAMVDEGRRYG